MVSVNVSSSQNYMSRTCQSAIQNSCQSATQQSCNSMQAKLSQAAKACGSSALFQSNFSINIQIQGSRGGCVQSGHMQKPQFQAGQCAKPPCGGMDNMNNLGNAMNTIAPMMQQIMQSLQAFLGGGASSQMNNQFAAGKRPMGGGSKCFSSFQSMQHACHNMNTQMGNFLGMSQSLQIGQHGMASSTSVRTTGKPAHFTPARGSDYLNTLKNPADNARRLNVSGRHDVKTINSAIGMTKNAAATLRPTRPGEKAKPGQMQLSAAQVASIQAAPNQAAAEALVTKYMGQAAGEKLGPINMNDKKGIRNTHNRHAMNKLLGTKVKSGREKNSGSSMVMNSMAASIAKGIRSGSFGTTNVDSSFAVQQFGDGGCHAMGFQASGYSHTSVDNAAGPLTVDLSQYRGAANKVGELYSPLIFDLEGQGLKIMNGGLIEVDLDGDGNTETITDLDAHQGLLVFDSKLETEDGEEHALGADLFGNGTDMTSYGIRGPEDDGTFANGFDALRAMAEHFELVHGDKQHLDAADLELLENEAGLRMRVGGVENGEDQTFTEVGISQINLGDADAIQSIEEAEEDAYGNRLMRQDGATFVVNDTERDYVDIWFNIVARTVTEKSQESMDKDLIASMMQVPVVRR